MTDAAHNSVSLNAKFFRPPPFFLVQFDWPAAIISAQSPLSSVASVMFDSEIILRLSLSLVIGLIIGIERQWHHKNAGLKTNTLVAVGSTAFALIAQHGFGLNNNPSQIAAGVVTGIGFLGAGVIMRRGGSVQGINTAATLWATTGMGLAVGAGYYALA